MKSRYGMNRYFLTQDDAMRAARGAGYKAFQVGKYPAVSKNGESYTLKEGKVPVVSTATTQTRLGNVTVRGRFSRVGGFEWVPLEKRV